MDDFIARISLNDLAEQERPSLRYESNHFLFHTSLFSLALIFHRSASRHGQTILTSKGLGYNFLTFTIFIIQSQVGAIPVFSRQFSKLTPSFCLGCKTTGASMQPSINCKWRHGWIICCDAKPRSLCGDLAYVKSHVKNLKVHKWLVDPKLAEMWRKQIVKTRGDV